MGWMSLKGSALVPAAISAQSWPSKRKVSMRVSALGTAISIRLKEVASSRFKEWPDKVAESRLLAQRDARGEDFSDDPTRDQRRVVVELNEVQ